jgi:hypothetical protein
LPFCDMRKKAEVATNMTPRNQPRLLAMVECKVWLIVKLEIKGLRELDWKIYDRKRKNR